MLLIFKHISGRSEKTATFIFNPAKNRIFLTDNPDMPV